MLVASSNTNSMDHQLFEDPFASSISSLEADIFSGQLPSPPWADIELDDDVQDFSAQAANATYSGSGSGSGPRSHKKLSHNAYERDRRKQLNELYSSLRNLLPDADQTKKLSIPSTVSRVLKYIPELQRQVENLERRKKELMNASSRQGVVGRLSECTSSPVVSATCINSKEVMVQISLLSNEASGTLPMSKCLRLFEGEGLRLISSSTFSNFENRTFYNLHLQRSPGMVNMDNPSYCEKLVKVIKKKAGPAGIRR